MFKGQQVGRMKTFNREGEREERRPRGRDREKDKDLEKPSAERDLVTDADATLL